MADRPDTRHRGGKAVVRDQAARGADEVASGQSCADRPCTRVGGVIGPSGLVDREGLRTHEAGQAVVGRGQGRRCRPVVDLGRISGDGDQQGLLADRAHATRRNRQHVVGQECAASAGEIPGRKRRAYSPCAGVGRVIGSGGLGNCGTIAANEARQAVVSGGERGRRSAVVGLAQGSDEADAQCPRTDGPRPASARRQDIVVEISGADGDEVGRRKCSGDRPSACIRRVIDPDGLCHLGALTGDKTGDLVAGPGERRRGVAVIGLRRRKADRDRQGSTVDRPDPGGEAWQQVVRQVRSAGAGEVARRQDRLDRARTGVKGVVGSGRLVDRRPVADKEARKAVVG